MLSREGGRVLECIIQITNDELRVIQVGTCDIARLGGESNITWYRRDVKSRSIHKRAGQSIV